MRNLRAVVVLVVLGLLAGMSATVQAQAGPRIGVFDSQRIIQETADGQRVQARINAAQSSKQAELQAKEEAITGLRTQMTQQALSLSPDRRQEIDLEIQHKLLDLENSSNLANKEMQLELSRAQREFNDRLLVAVESFGRDEGFDLLLEYGVIAWAGPSIDVTTALIDRIDAMYPAVATTEAAPATP